MKQDIVEFTAMGCPCRIEAFAATEKTLKRALTRSLNEIDRIESKYSRYRSSSWISAVNRTAGSLSWHMLDQETAGLLSFADRLHEISKGRFDITSGVFRRLWRFASHDQPMSAPPATDAIQSLLPLVNQTLIERTSDGLRLPHEGMSLDLGGIVKEYACDRVSQMLREQGIEAACINLGGDIAVFGKRHNQAGWRLGLENPSSAGVIDSELVLTEGCLATSGDYARCFVFEGRRYSHLIDALTGWPVDTLQAVSVVGPRCTAAGAVATLAMLQGQDWRGFLLEQGLAWRSVDANDHIEYRDEWGVNWVPKAIIRR